jgi:sugar phosphate isomerase/epimerase
MRFGLCTNMVAAKPDKTGTEALELLASLGYDYVELPLAEIALLGNDEFNRVVTRLETLEIPCECCNNLFPRYVKLTGPSVCMDLIKEHAIYALGRARQLGADTVVFGSGVARNVAAGFSFVTALEQLGNILEMISPIADGNNIRLVLEPARKPDCNIINSFNEAVEWRDRAASSPCGIMVDYFHMNWHSESPRDFALRPDLLGHVHLACPDNKERGERCMPSLDDGWVYDDFVNSLRECGYDRRISIEAYTGNLEFDARKALEFLRTTFGQ